MLRTRPPLQLRLHLHMQLHMQLRPMLSHLCHEGNEADCLQVHALAAEVRACHDGHCTCSRHTGRQLQRWQGDRAACGARRMRGLVHLADSDVNRVELSRGVVRVLTHRDIIRDKGVDRQLLQWVARSLHVQHS